MGVAAVVLVGLLETRISSITLGLPLLFGKYAVLLKYEGVQSFDVQCDAEGA